MNYEILPEYIPVDSSSLRTDTKIGCDLYLLISNAPEGRCVLYCRGDAVFDNNKREMLLEKTSAGFLLKITINRNIINTWNLIFKISYMIQTFHPTKRLKLCMALQQVW